MRLIVDTMPKEPKECLFSKKESIGENYLCGFHGCVICNVDKCKKLKPIDKCGFAYKKTVYR